MHLASLFNRYLIPLLRKYGYSYSDDQKSALWAICNCRTSALGNIVFKCPDCGQVHHTPHSCGNRSCPQCHHHSTVAWFERQQQKLIPERYYLITFTVPFELRSTIYQNQRLAYSLMFKAAEQTINAVATNRRHLGAAPGFTAVLHTNSRKLDFHPHIHIVMPGGGIHNNQWISKSRKHMFPHDVLKDLFRGKLLSFFKQNRIAFDRCIYKKKWAANIKAAGGGAPALKYLSRYLNKGVIQDKNILSDVDGAITFQYFDSADKHWKKRSLPALEFLDLILQHVLPKGFRRARDYGFLHGNAKKTLHQIQLLLEATPPPIESKPPSRPLCPQCEHRMIIVTCKVFPKHKIANTMRAPP
jgi:hypothetical protein